MPTILLYVAAFFVVLIIASKIPGLTHFVKPVIDIIFTLFKLWVATGYSWFVIIVKAIIGSHFELIKHLLNNAEDLDPTLKMKK